MKIVDILQLLHLFSHLKKKKKFLKSKLLSKISKEYLYSSFLRPALTYGSETWSVTKADEEKMNTFEGRVLRRIYGPLIENEIIENEQTKKFTKYFINSLSVRI